MVMASSFPTLSTWLLAIPNSIWYSAAISLMTLSISCSSSIDSAITSTSSTHSRLGIFVLVSCSFIPSPFALMAWFIWSIIMPYCSTASTPPCLRLSLICIALVWPYLVLRVAVRLSFRFRTVSHNESSSPLSYRMCMIPRIHALSYAFVTSWKPMYTSFFLFFADCIACWRMSRWSVVALPALPPACASVISTIVLSLSLIILSNSFPMLLANVIPLSFEHMPFFPFLCIV